MFVTAPSEKDIPEGEKVSFVCRVHGKPLPEVSWLRNGRALTEADGASIERKQKPDKHEVESKLTLDKVILNDESEQYVIEAENAVGQASHQFGLVGEFDYIMALNVQGYTSYDAS